MLKYLIIPLADNAVSYCHYKSGDSPKEISVEILKRAIKWAMKENLSVQFLYPASALSYDIINSVDEIDHTNIIPYNTSNDTVKDTADVVVFDNWQAIDGYDFVSGCSYVIRTSLSELLHNEDLLKKALMKADRINVVFTDIQSINESNLEDYNDFLHRMVPTITDIYKAGRQVQLNLLTDRLMLKEMNNCNAGDESIMLASDGKFYACPAFYYEESNNIGDLDNGLNQKNPQLYKLSHAPICMICDAFQCKRCIWSNKKMTQEINTPSHEQCVMAHYERNASRDLLIALRNIYPEYLSEIDIPTISYLDPFDKIVNSK